MGEEVEEQKVPCTGEVFTSNPPKCVHWVALHRELESLRDEAVRALEPFAKARPTETGFDPADGDALLSTRHHNPIGLHEWVIARDLHTRLSRATSSEGKPNE